MFKKSQPAKAVATDAMPIGSSSPFVQVKLPQTTQPTPANQFQKVLAPPLSIVKDKGRNNTMATFDTGRYSRNRPRGSTNDNNKGEKPQQDMIEKNVKYIKSCKYQLIIII